MIRRHILICWTRAKRAVLRICGRPFDDERLKSVPRITNGKNIPTSDSEKPLRVLDDPSTVTAEVQNTDEPSNAVESITETVNSAQTSIVEMSSNGFSPTEIRIKVGDTVKFTNVGTQQYWPASAMHPSHTVYPGSSISKCNTAEASTIFDACRAYGPGETYSFKFNEIGSWKYHDHRNPSAFGTIIVE